MKTIELTITKKQKPRQILEDLRKRKLMKGDRVKIKRKGDVPTEMMVIMVLLLVIWYFNNQLKKKKSFGDQVEEMLFDKTISTAVLEKQVEKLFGIKLELEPEQNEERLFWQQAAVASMSKAYDQNEKDYKDVKLMESNPHYKVWKQVQ